MKGIILMGTEIYQPGQERLTTHTLSTMLHTISVQFTFVRPVLKLLQAILYTREYLMLYVVRPQSATVRANLSIAFNTVWVGFEKLVF